MISQTLMPYKCAGFSVLLSVVVSAATFGWVAPVMNHFLDPSSDLYMTPAQLSWMIVIPEVGDLLASIPACLLADKWGRKPFLLFSGSIFAVGWIIIVFTKSYIVIFLVRAVQGFAIGIVFSVVPKYVVEISTPAENNPITDLFSGAWFLGYLIEYCVGSLVSYSMFTVITAFIPVIFTVIFCYQPESPHYLVMIGNNVAAVETLTKLREGHTEKEILDEFEEIQKSTDKRTDILATVLDCRTLFTIFLVRSFKIISGFLIIMSYSTQLLSEHTTTFSPDLFTMAMVFSLFWGGCINNSIVDILGRRPLIFISTIGSFLCILALTVYLFIHTKLTTRISTSSYGWVIPLAIISYFIFSMVGIYPVSVTYTSEMFTSKNRGQINITSMVVTIVSLICVRTYKNVSVNYGVIVVVLFFTNLSLIGVLLFYTIVPETKTKTISQVQEFFVKPSTVWKNLFKRSNPVIEV